MGTFYLETVCMYFFAYIVIGILFKKHFIKARDKVRKELNDNSKIKGTIETTFYYLIISFIPVIRFIGLVSKWYMIIDTDGYIEMLKERQKRGKEC